MFVYLFEDLQFLRISLIFWRLFLFFEERKNKLFDDFESGSSFGQLTLDAAALFLCVATNKLKSNIFLSFKNEKAAYSFYLLATGLEPDRFLFYPAPDLSEKVPGFNIESERYREDALIKLAENNRFYVCAATRASLKERNNSEFWV